MYSEEVMQAVRQCLDLEPDDTSQDSQISFMSRSEVFEKCLNWEGIVGYSQIILSYIRGIWHIDLEPQLFEAEDCD